MLLINNPIFCDPWGDERLPVVEITPDMKIENLDDKHVYLVGDYIYKFIKASSFKDIKPGVIVCVDGRYLIEPHTEESGECYHRKYIVSEDSLDKRVKKESFADMFMSYHHNYQNDNNIIRSGNIKIVPVGDVFMPDLEPDDDPLERIIKLMLRHIKPVMNEHRDSFTKKHGLDNIKSALNGATKNMSIVKFLAWCDSFDLDWDITITNLDENVMNPLIHPIELSSRTPMPWIIIPSETKGCFTVPLIEGEDPLKRGIKLALAQKNINIKDYNKRSPTPHLLNNMKAALKIKQKMTLPYFIYWCEIIDMRYSIKVTSRADGIWYKITGYDVTTNDKEME